MFKIFGLGPALVILNNLGQLISSSIGEILICHYVLGMHHYTSTSASTLNSPLKGVHLVSHLFP